MSNFSLRHLLALLFDDSNLASGCIREAEKVADARNQPVPPMVPRLLTKGPTQQSSCRYALTELSHSTSVRTYEYVAVIHRPAFRHDPHSPAVSRVGNLGPILTACEN
jgi:hypothetical protein